MNDQVEESTAKSACKFGVMIGLTALIELICGFIFLSKGGRDGSGLWSGAGLGVICALGIVTWVKKNKIVLVFYLVMCILWFIVSLIQLALASLTYRILRVIRKVVETNCSQIGDICKCFGAGDTTVTVHNCDDLRTLERIFLCITLISAAAALLTLAGSLTGCKGTCCAQPAQPSNMVVMQQPAGYPVVMQQPTMTQEAYPAELYPEQQPYPGQQPVMKAQGGEAPPSYDQGGLPPKQEQQPAGYPVVMQQVTMTQQEYPAQPYPGQQPNPGQQPVMLAQGGDARPGYDQHSLPPKQEQTNRF